MRKGVLGVLLFSSIITVFGGPALPNFDRRSGVAPETVISPERNAARESLSQQVSGIQIDFDPIIGSVSHIAGRQRLLTRPIDQEIAERGPFGVRLDDQHRAIKVFLAEHATLFGHGPEIFADAIIEVDDVAIHNGLRTVIWRQQLYGIPVYQGLFSGFITRNGELVSLSSHFMSRLKAAATSYPPPARLVESIAVSPQNAIVQASANLGESIAGDDILISRSESQSEARRHTFTTKSGKAHGELQLTWLPTSPESVRLCWNVHFTSKVSAKTELVVDAQTSEVLVRRSLTSDYTNPSYLVFNSDSPSPFSPGHTSPNLNQPTDISTPAPEYVSRVMVQESTVRSSSGSPNGWTDTSNRTTGPNVDAYLDRDANDVPDVARPQVNGNGEFNFPLDLSQAPSQYTDASVVQLFYWCNWMHDRLYELGFTETMRNFQGNDFMIAHAQYGADAGLFNNGAFLWAPDGQSGHLEIRLWNGPNPDRDGALDTDLILHEYTHGLSNRLVGGGAGPPSVQHSQADGLNEGWSDFYPFAFVSQAGDDLTGTYPHAAYSYYLFSGGLLTQNYYFGGRRYPTCTSFSKNPLTFKDIDKNRFSTHSGVSLSPVWTFDPSFLAGLSHSQAEVWCVTLWEMRANLIQKYGFSVGNQLTLQLVTDAMKITPANPTFIVGRDKILTADQINNAGANQKEIWTAFYKRGIGSSAVDQTVTPDVPAVVEAFNEGDFNLDGYHDLVLQNGGSIKAWFMNAQNRIGESSFSVSTDPSWAVKGCAEITRDGKVDLVFQDVNGYIARWALNGTTFVDANYFFPSNPGDVAWRIVGTGDFDRDTKIDLLWQHDNGTLAVWYMDVNGSLGEGPGNIEMRSSALLNPSSPGDPKWRIVGTGDFDRDGKVDILFQYSNPGGGGDGDLAVWHMDGVNLKSGGANLLSPSNPGDPHWRVVATEDYDRDGDTDLIFQFKNPGGYGDGDLAVWFMNDFTLVSAQYLNPQNPGSGWNGVAPK